MMESVHGPNATALGLSYYISSFKFDNLREYNLLLSLEEAGYKLGSRPIRGKESCVEVMKSGPT